MIISIIKSMIIGFFILICTISQTNSAGANTFFFGLLESYSKTSGFLSFIVGCILIIIFVFYGYITRYLILRVQHLCSNVFVLYFFNRLKWPIALPLISFLLALLTPDGNLFFVAPDHPDFFKKDFHFMSVNVFSFFVIFFFIFAYYDFLWWAYQKLMIKCAKKNTRSKMTIFFISFMMTNLICFLFIQTYDVVNPSTSLQDQTPVYGTK